MSLFAGASEFEVHDGSFAGLRDNFGTIVLGASRNEDSRNIVRRLVQQDSAFNHYSTEAATLAVPHFSQSLLLQDMHIDYDSRLINTGSCAIDLASRLGLLPGQANERLAEYDASVPLDALVTRGNCYCARISRHGLIFLISKYFQHASREEIAGGGICINLVTTIGRFKLYEINDRTFVHFDPSTRSSNVNLIPNQQIEDIVKAAQGQYLINSQDQITEFRWRQHSVQNLESSATGYFFGVPNAIIYMNREAFARWNGVRDFAELMEDAMLSVMDNLPAAAPETFVAAWNSIRHLHAVEDLPENETVPETLAACVWLLRVLNQMNMATMNFESFYHNTRLQINSLIAAHQHYRSPRIVGVRLFQTSTTRFAEIFQQYQGVATATQATKRQVIQRELRQLLESNPNNVALVVYQGLLALVARWNASRVLEKAREVPQEWITFVGADEDEIYLG